jgi:hypothetical protein
MLLPQNGVLSRDPEICIPLTTHNNARYCDSRFNEPFDLRYTSNVASMPDVWDLIAHPSSIISHSVAILRHWRTLKIFSHVHNPNSLSILTPKHIFPPTPLIPTLLIQLHTTQRCAHLQPLKPLDHAWLSVTCPRLAVPHHHRPQTFARKLRRCEYRTNTCAVSSWIALFWHTQR